MAKAAREVKVANPKRALPQVLSSLLRPPPIHNPELPLLAGVLLGAPSTILVHLVPMQCSPFPSIGVSPGFRLTILVHPDPWCALLAPLSLSPTCLLAFFTPHFYTSTHLPMLLLAPPPANPFPYLPLSFLAPCLAPSQPYWLTWFLCRCRCFLWESSPGSRSTILVHPDPWCALLFSPYFPSHLAPLPSPLFKFHIGLFVSHLPHPMSCPFKGVKDTPVNRPGSPDSPSCPSFHPNFAIHLLILSHSAPSQHLAIRSPLLVLAFFCR